MTCNQKATITNMSQLTMLASLPEGAVPLKPCISQTVFAEKKKKMVVWCKISLLVGGNCPHCPPYNKPTPAIAITGFYLCISKAIMCIAITAQLTEHHKTTTARLWTMPLALVCFAGPVQQKQHAANNATRCSRLCLHEAFHQDPALSAQSLLGQQPTVQATCTESSQCNHAPSFYEPKETRNTPPQFLQHVYLKAWWRAQERRCQVWPCAITKSEFHNSS